MAADGITKAGKGHRPARTVGWRYNGTMETRVPRAGLPGPNTSSEIFAKDQAFQAWRGSPSLASLAEGFSLGEGPLLERAPSQRLGEVSSLAEFPSSGSQLCLRDRAHMGSASSVESWARQRAVTPALSLPFLCIKRSTKQRQAKELQGLPFR